MSNDVVLIVGGSGYLGQFLVHGLSKQGLTCWYTHHSSDTLQFQHPTRSFRVDMRSAEEKNTNDHDASGFAACFHDDSAHIVAVVNCAAVSQPKICEEDPDVAYAINVPSKLLNELQSYRAHTSRSPLLIQISTDQVYDGTASFWKESDRCNPVNAYGRSKLKAEESILATWSNVVILRSSIIYGDLPPAAPVGRSLFLQFVDDALARGQATPFFDDEWRCPVYVQDIVAVCEYFIKDAMIEKKHRQEVFNMGGPERLNRVQMAEAVAMYRGYDRGCIVPSSSRELVAQRGYLSPADISMDSSKLQRTSGIRMRTMKEAFDDIWGH